MYVYVLIDGSEDYGQCPKRKIDSIHETKEKAEQEKRKKWSEGAFFPIEKWEVK